MDQKTEPRGRIGRPIKDVPRGKKRIQISMIVSAELKTRIAAKAKREGRTLSQMGEMMLERADVVDGLLQTIVPATKLGAMASSQSPSPAPIKTFYYVRHSEVADWLRCGWIAYGCLRGIRHGDYAVLCEWLCDCPVARPGRTIL